jgi:hypothetical protein
MSAILSAAPAISRRLHETAIALGRHALGTRRIGFRMLARAEFWIAYRLECEAARLLPENAEPAKAVLCRSAAFLAFHAGDMSEAARLAGIGLQSWMPDEIAESLRDVQRRAAIALRPRKSGLSLAGR